MRDLLEAAADAQFISNREVASLPRRLASDGHFPELTAAFDKLVENRDWRKLPS